MGRNIGRFFPGHWKLVRHNAPFIPQKVVKTSKNEKRMLIMDPNDNVGVMLEDIRANDSATFERITLPAREEIEFAHKITLVDIAKGEDIIKYGEVIGYALTDIPKGSWVHIHNMDDVRGREGRL